MALLGGLVTPGPVSATPLTNDYPSWLRAQPRDALVDPWYFYNRECTSFTAWRLTNDNRLPFRNNWGGVHWGNAYQWGAAARALGFPINNTPSVGSVAWWNGSNPSASSFGHVAWVAKVYSDGSVLIEEYNYLSAGNYDQRHLYPGTYWWPSGFLHVGDLTMVNSSAPTIPGTPTVGVPVTASPGAWRPAWAVTYSYAWYANGVAIPGANAQRFTPTPTQFGQKLSVKVTASMSGAKSTTVSSVLSRAVAQGTLVASGSPVVVGAPQVGVPLVAQGATWRPTPAVTYQWFSDGVAIPGATSATYTPQASDLGATITVTITATATGYKMAAATARTSANVLPGVFVNTVRPGINGGSKPVVGTWMRAVAGSWTPNATFAYQWFNGTTPIPGATSASFAPTPDLLTKQLTVKVTASAPGYTSKTISTPISGAIIPGTFQAPALANLPTPAVGAPLTIDPGTITGTTMPTVTYQWKLNGVAIRGATAATYVPTPGQLNKRLSVTVTASAPGYNTLTRTTALSRAVQLGTLQVVMQPSLPGNPQYGVVSRYLAAAWSATPSSVTYQWYANGVAIRGATKSTYTPTPGVVGQLLSVIERVTSPGYHPASVKTNATAFTIGGTTSLASRPVLGGTALVGKVLTLTAGAPFPSDATTSVQWLRDGLPIRYATKWTYTLTATDLLHRISARVTVSRNLWTSSTYTSNVTGPVQSQGTMVSRVTRLANGRVRISAVITAPGVPTPGGAVQVRWGSTGRATATTVGGRITFDVPIPSWVHAVNLYYFREPRIRMITQLNVPIR